MPTSEEEAAKLEAAITALEAQRAVLGEDVVEAALASLREKLTTLRQVLPEQSRPAQDTTLEQADLLEPPLQGERKFVTVMFADISGFTHLAETMDPEAVRDLMNSCFEQLVPIIQKYEGTVDKFMGDGVMALFGAPITHENDAERALLAALEMMDALTAFNVGRNTALGLHIGINTGLVIAGGIGTRGRQTYSVMGDTVNLASRIGEAAAHGEILVGPDAHHLTERLFVFAAEELIWIKGKAEPVPVFRLQEPRAVAGKVRGIAGLESPLVGRQAEFQALQAAIEQLQAGKGGIVTIVGEAGLGKSRLVAELRTTAGAPDRLPLQWIEGRCLSYGTSIAYLPWLEVLRALLGVTAESPAPALGNALRRRVQDLCPDRFEKVFPYLGRLMSLPLETEPAARWLDLEGEPLKAGTFQAVETLLECAAQQQPLIVVCEDLHWADSISIDLLEYLLPLTERTPLLFICVFRPERSHRCWHVREIAIGIYRLRHTDLWLAPLSLADSTELVGNLLRVEDLPQQLRERILRRAEGNPFYVEEIIRSLIDDGAIVRDESAGRWMATRDVTEIAIPDTLHGVLVARIDQLQEEAKRVLQLAAVVGRIFFYRILAEILREERELEGELAQHLLTLQREEMIRQRTQSPELEFIFKHHLTQEAAYNSLLKRERRRFHRRVGEALERLFADRIEEQIGLLAHHWEQAEEPEKATAYLLLAGDRARLVYAHEEAIDYYQRALAFLRGQEELELASRTLMKLGLTYHTAFDFQRARQAYEEGFTLWQQAAQAELIAPPPAPHALRGSWPEPTTLDPCLCGEVYSGGVIDQLFSGLVEHSSGMDLVPDLAHRWEVSEGGRKYIFYLRDDVRWSDGTPVTAGDFEYAWKQVLDPANQAPKASLLYDVKGAEAFHRGELSNPDHIGVRALDERTLAVELEGPTGYFPHLLVHLPPVPRHVLEAYGGDWTEADHFVSNGPFQLETWHRGKSIVLVRNPEYHGRFAGNVQRVELTLLPLTAWARRIELYEAGSLDMLDIRVFPPAERERARQRHAGEYVSIPALSTSYVGFDVSRPPFDDPSVRQAFVLASDRETLPDVVLKGSHFPATGGFIPPGMPGHSAGIALPYDPDRAKHLLAAAGYPNGRNFPPVQALMPTGPDLQGEYLQAQWQEILGVEIIREATDWADFLDKLQGSPPHMFFTGWGADYPDPDTFLRTSSVRRWTRWQNETYDRLVEQARGLTDQGERIKLYEQADRILVEEAAIIPLFYGRRHLLIKPWVKKYPTSAIKTWFWKDVVVDPH